MKSIILVLIIVLISSTVHAQAFGDRDSAANIICKSLQDNIKESDYRAFEQRGANTTIHFRQREELELYANGRGLIQCFAQVINYLGKNSRDRNAEAPSEGMMFAIAGMSSAMSQVLGHEEKDKDKRRAELDQWLTESIDLNGMNLLVYGAQSSNQYIRQYSLTISSWVLSNKTFCVINDHADVDWSMKTEYGKKGLRNLLTLSTILAPQANRENFERITKLVERVEKTNFSSLNVETASTIVENVKVRLAHQDKLEAPPKQISNPEFAKDCSSYGRN